MAQSCDAFTRCCGANGQFVVPFSIEPLDGNPAWCLIGDPAREGDKTGLRHVNRGDLDDQIVFARFHPDAALIAD